MKIGSKHTKEAKRKISDKLKDKNKGQIRSIETRNQMSRTRKKLIKEGKLIVWNQREENVAKRPEVRKKLKENHWSRNPLVRDTVMKQLKHTQFKKGQIHSPETNKKKGRSGNKNGRWIDGRSFKPYGSEFNKELKEKIKKRDNYICQLCKDKITKQTKKKFLTVHHIDYNKFNNKKNNLISLCNFCNSSVNTSRESWTKFFNNKITQIPENVWGVK